MNELLALLQDGPRSREELMYSLDPYMEAPAFRMRVVRLRRELANVGLTVRYLNGVYELRRLPPTSE